MVHILPALSLSLALYFHRIVLLFYHKFWWNNHYDIVFIIIIIIILGQTHCYVHLNLRMQKNNFLLAQSGTFPNYVLMFENDRILMIKNYHFKTSASLESVGFTLTTLKYLDICALLDLFYKDYYLQMYSH